MGLKRWLLGSLLLLLLTTCGSVGPAVEQSISMYDNRFEPLEVTVARAEVLRLRLFNQGNDVHNFEINVGGHKAVVIGPKLDNTVTLFNPAPGRYPFICSVPGHQGMQGTLTVVDEATSK